MSADHPLSVHTAPTSSINQVVTFMKPERHNPGQQIINKKFAAACKAFSCEHITSTNDQDENICIFINSESLSSALQHGLQRFKLKV